MPIISKIFERHIANQLHVYLKSTDVIYNYQSGFRQHHSCSTALTRLIDCWLRDIDEGKIIGTVFLDLRKAFDMVNHNILLYKMKLFNFSENAIKFFTSYLSNRSQLVQSGNTKSEFLDIKSGVPQGSILGPIFFIMYVNDMAYTCTNSLLDLYADDSSLHKSGTDINEIQYNLQTDLNNIQTWCENNNMALHPRKSQCMLIGPTTKLNKLNDLYLTIDGQTLENIKCKKVLGLSIDNNLSWHDHVQKVCKRLNSTIALLKRINYCLCPDMRIMFYNSYFVSIFDYCCFIWGKKKVCSNKILLLQKRAARIILNQPARTPSKPLFEELKWLTFPDRCNYHAAVLVFKTIRNTAPSYMNEIITIANNNVYSLRSQSHEHLSLTILPKTRYLKDSFTYYSFNIWNSIPLYIRQVNTEVRFKRMYKRYLFQLYHGI